MSQIQLIKLNCLLDRVARANRFYADKWRQGGVCHFRLSRLEELSQFPLTTRAELITDQNAAPPLGMNLTEPLEAFKRVHCSSGTTGAKVYWADTHETWNWVVNCSRLLYQTSGIRASDRLFFATCFGAASGPWITYQGALALGCASFTTGDSAARDQISALRRFQANVIVGKPRQLLSLAAEAERMGTALSELGLQKLILTGGRDESANTRVRKAFPKVECFDRYGLTEAGSVASECPAHPNGMHVLEMEFVVEVIHPETLEPVGEGELGELILTALGRAARPIIRYRTGDLIRLVRQHACPCGRSEALLMGGMVRRRTPPPPQGTGA